ncbi:hypothetical protein [Larkinella soli]|uniref:hypothetical protein n=1 Tax=Larkinella soli TaxID=1770527 RepID=UPI000FFC8384|nr:hypothetical protein [Larkinella soli]
MNRPHLMTYRPALLFVVLLTAAGTAFGQNVARTTFREQAVEYARNRYLRSTADQARLYNGPEFIPYSPNIKGHPYLDSLWQTGSVQYDGVLYRNISLLYDVVGDAVIVPHSDSLYRIRLQSMRIGGFDLPGHTFIRVDADSARNSGLKTGFYDRLYDGRRVDLLAKRVKTIKTDFVHGAVVEEYLNGDTYYIGRNGVFTPVRSKRAVLAMFADQKKPLRKYLRENRIKFRRDREGAIVKLTRRYDETSQ